MLSKLTRRTRNLLATQRLCPFSQNTISKWSKAETYKNLRGNIRGEATSLNPEAYYSPAFTLAEENQLWKKSWFAAAHCQSLKNVGDTHVVDVADQSYILTRDKDMKVRAFHNACRHRGARLCKTGSKNRKRISCPYHRWTYKLDGELVGTPFFKDQEIEKKDYGLLTVHAEEFAGLVWINASESKTVAPVREAYGDMTDIMDALNMQDFNLLEEKDYKADCDWKLLAENFMEWYHLPPVHPELVKFSRMDEHFQMQGDGNYCGFVTSPLTDSGGAADSTLFNPHPDHPRGDLDTAFFYHLFPNVSITVYPHSVYTLLMFPNGPGKCNEKLSLLQHPVSRLATDGDATYELKTKALMKFVCTVNDEDIEICEGVQKGLKVSGYKGGIFHDPMERSVYRFQNMIADKMQGVNPGLYPAEMTSHRDAFPESLASPPENPMDLVKRRVAEKREGDEQWTSGLEAPTSLRAARFVASWGGDQPNGSRKRVTSLARAFSTSVRN